MAGSVSPLPARTASRRFHWPLRWMRRVTSEFGSCGERDAHDVEGIAELVLLGGETPSRFCTGFDLGLIAAPGGGEISPVRRRSGLRGFAPANSAARSREPPSRGRGPVLGCRGAAVGGERVVTAADGYQAPGVSTETGARRRRLADNLEIVKPFARLWQYLRLRSRRASPPSTRPAATRAAARRVRLRRVAARVEARPASLVWWARR